MNTDRQLKHLYKCMRSGMTWAYLRDLTFLNDAELTNAIKELAVMLRSDKDWAKK